MSSPQQQRVVDSQKYMDRFHRYSGTGVPSPHQYDSASASGYSSFRARVGRPQSTTLETLAVMSGILESPSSSHPLVERLRTVLLSRGVDGLGFAELQRRIYMMDRDGSHVLSLDEFKIAMQKCNFGFNDKEIFSLFELFDGSNRGSYLDIDNFLCVVRGVVNQERRDLIRRTFQLLDASNEGLLDPQLVIERYDPTQHPDVVTGRKRAQEVFRIFLRTFEVGGEVENKITKNEFYNYYFNLSAAVEEDAYFTALLCGPWHLDQQSFSSSPSGSKKQSPAVTHRINTGKKHGKVNTFSYEDSKEDCSVETSNYKTNTNFDYQDYKFHRIRQPSQSKLLPRSQNEAEKEEVWNSGYSSQRNDIASTRNYHN